ncbi:serine-rich adhesin for platelets isoform X2 [Drosophila ficusphila]|uniref:serine-rich adhesin for platelets isoform X2 n=1 Tax=Drosophila ficusphila TaxID=30025 RepID=UPI0007E890FE|nr:serine-rich adhesin for platelets isoform X2 [Drosophila ficusphila]
MVAGGSGSLRAQANPFQLSFAAELTDVLRKRRNRPDASDEDLGLPRSPASPQRRAAGGTSSRNNSGVGHHQLRGHQSEVSSLSLLSVNSAEAETEDSQGSHHQRHHSRVSTSSSISIGSDILRPHHEDDVDAVGGERHRLSHAAAKHKMAIRPVKKKGPTRTHRMTLETSIPEANEDVMKMSPGLRAVHDAELKSKTRSLPPKTLTAIAPPAQVIPASSVTTKRTKTIEQSSSINSTTKVTTSSSSTSASSSSTQMFGLRGLTTKSNTLLENRGESSTDGDDFLANEREHSESGFLRRLIHRNSKRSIARANDGVEDTDSSQSVAKKLQISTSCLEAAARESVQVPDKSRSATSHEQHIQETRQTIKREIHNEGRHGLNAMVSNYGVHPQPPTPLKPKSGPAARQRYMPKELGAVSPVEKISSSNDVTNLLSKSSRGNDTFQSTTLVREQQTKVETSTHFERKPRIVGLSAFQQKLSRSSDSVGQHSSSSNSLETSTDEPSPLYYEEKQRKTVEKSRSFRNYEDETVDSIGASVHNNMPSLPDLSLSFRVPAYYKQSPQSPCSPISPNTKCVSLGFEINDNKLLQARAESAGQLPSQGKPSPQRAATTKLIVSSPGSANISQIEHNIDLIVKSPMVSVLRKSGNVVEKLPKEPTTPTKQRPKLLDLGAKSPAPAAIATPSPASPLTKSAKLSNSPPSTPAKNQSSSNSNSRRNSSNVETTSGEPEFMKIQLNRVDQARLHNKTNHVVLAKNLKSPTERSQSSDDLSFRRNSGENLAGIEIIEHPQPKPLSPVVRPTTLEPSLGKQLRSVSANSVRTSYGSSSEGLATPVTPATTPSTPKSNGLSKGIKSPTRESKDSKEQGNPKDSKESVKSNRLSLEDRKRLFLSEERPKLMEQRRKSIPKAEISAPPTPSVTPATPAIPVTPVTPTTPELSEVNGNSSPTSNPVVLRKKSFASCNGNPSPTKDDPTPELMKVFARRSLKVKDDDVVTLTAQVQATSPVTKKMPSTGGGGQSVDSDKENQSNSEEKLDKLAHPGTTDANKVAHHPSSNRNSVADFRNLNNNNNNNQQQQQQQKVATKVVTYLPPIKVSNAGRNSLNNNLSNNNGSAKPAERFSLQLKQATPTSPVAAAATAVATPVAATSAVATAGVATPSKPIERSATVGEFKGIHQRRAEWEQRAKEALK